MQNRKNIFIRIFYILAALLLVLTVCRGIVLAGRQPGHGQRKLSEAAQVSLHPLNYGWMLHHSDGSFRVVSLPYEFEANESSISITKDVKGILRDGDVLKFDNHRQGVTVIVDGKTVYAVNTTSLTNQLRFTDYQLIDLPDAKNISSICLKIDAAKDGSFILPEISYGSYANAANEIIRGDLFTLVIVIILAMFLALTTVTTLTSFIRGSSYQSVLDITIFLAIAIAWGLTDSYLPVLTQLPQEVIGLINYLSIMALPLPICHYVWVTVNSEHITQRIIFIIGAVNLIAQALLSCFGIIHLQYTFYAAHVLIVAVIVVSIRSIYLMRKTSQAMDVKILYAAIILLAFVAVLSLIVYWFKGGVYYRNCMLAGVLLFTIFLCIYIIVHFVLILQDDRIKISESLMHEQLSLHDTLTGLPNRRAFENKIEQIESDPESMDDVVLLMLDLNGLKLVNDQYGHSAGDDLIVTAANVIHSTYGKYGTCYRIGGDEFVAILDDLSISLSSLDEILNANLAKVNASKKWKLSIAKGESHLIDAGGHRLSISDWKQEADVNMYRNKVSMSGSRSLERSQNLRDIIDCIVSTVEAKDKYTAVHSERVRELSCCIAEKLGVSELTMQNLSVAAQLHDIGKIGVPDSILLKEGKLTAEEYDKIKLHSQIGASIIRRDQGMKEVAEIVLHHHERWDGKGYPDGLYRKDIPMESRIIAVADSIDAMTSKRVYRDSMPIDKCREEIERNAGLMYDPAIVKIVLQNWDEIINIVMMHPKHLV